MVPPKYNFYVGKANNYAYPTSNITIDDSGNFSYGAGSDKYATNRLTLQINECIFFNFISINSHNRIFFYDKEGAFISSKSLLSANDTIIIPPSSAKYWAARFTKTDTNFAIKKDTNFIYSIENVKPHFKDLNKKYAKESGQEFFRISLDGKINLFGDAYEIVNQSSLEDQLIFIIDKYNRISNKWVEYYKGEFNKTDCKFDHEKKKCELKTTAIDSYTDVMNKYDNTYDLIKLAPEITRIDLHKRSLMQVYVRGANSITNFFGGTYWEDDVNSAIDSHDDLINKYYFAYIKAGNEFYVKRAGIEAVNGVYAGTNGYWSQWNGYTCYMGTDTPGVKAYIYIKRNSDDTILYRSEKQWTFLEKDNCYIGREDIVMVNVNNSSDKFTIESPFVYHIYRRLLCDVDTVEDSEDVKNTYNLPSDDFVTDNRNYKKCIGLRGGMFFCTSRAADEPTKYGLNDYGQYFTNQFIPSSAGIGRALPISKNSWVNASLWYVYDSFYEYFEERMRKQYTLKDSYSIGAAIKAILKKIDPTISHETTAEYSQFLYGDTNPLGLAKFYVYITQKTNILKGNYDQPAQKAKTSLEELMKMLRDCFRCYWYIEDNKFKIEHIYFFMNGGSYSNDAAEQLDFTVLTDQFNKKLSSYFQSEVEFEKSDLNQRYEFGWMDDVTDLFGGATIDVKSNYIQKDKTEEINIGQFSSDVDFMLFNPSNFSDDGFALLCPIKNETGTYKETVRYGSDYTNISGYGVSSHTGKLIANDAFSSSNFIQLKANHSKIRLQLSGMQSYGVAFYANATEDSFISGLVGSTGTTVYNIPGNAKYIRFCIANSQFGANFITTSIPDFNLDIPIITVENLIDENGDTYKAIAQNWYASWIYLQNFYMWDMPAQNIESNVVGILHAWDVKKCMKHTIEFPSEEDLDELELVKTAFGNGKIDEMSFNINTRQAKVNLLYRPQ